MKHDIIQIGQVAIELDWVEYEKTEVLSEDGSKWLSGQAGLSYFSENYWPECEQITIGCWEDTDDDNADWCADNEGAKAINACLGCERHEDTRGMFARAAWPDECRRLGAIICARLRAEREAKDGQEEEEKNDTAQDQKTL